MVNAFLVFTLLFGAVLFVSADPTTRSPKPRGPPSPNKLTTEFFADGSYVATVKGTWTTDDGFFELPEIKEKGIVVGTCSFRQDDSWTCTTSEREYTDAAGDHHEVSQHVFHGTNYTGTPGGSLKKL